MLFPLLPTIATVFFALIWAFVGGMIYRDSQVAVQDDLETTRHRVYRPTERRDSSQSLAGPHRRRQRAASRVA